MQVEEPRSRLALVREGVDDVRRHEHERPGRRAQRLAAQPERQRALEHDESVGVVVVDVRVGACSPGP